MRTIPASMQMAARTNQSATFLEPVKGSVPDAGAAVVVVTAATATTFVVVVTAPVAPTATKLFAGAWGTHVMVSVNAVPPIVSPATIVADFSEKITSAVLLVGVHVVLPNAVVTVNGAI